MTCNYKWLAERNSYTHRVQTDRRAVRGGFFWTINLLHTCLVFRRLQWRRAKYDVTHLNNSQGRHHGRTNTARHVGRATELGRWRLSFVGPGWGNWFMSFTWHLKFSAGSYTYGKFVHVWCRLLAKGLLNWKFWGTQPRSQAVWTINTFLGLQVAWHNSVCITVNIPSGTHVDEMQIPCSEPCADFATNVSSNNGFTWAVNYLLNHKAMISNSMQESYQRSCQFLS